VKGYSLRVFRGTAFVAAHYSMSVVLLSAPALRERIAVALACA
jgi:hypothetical protein